MFNKCLKLLLMLNDKAWAAFTVVVILFFAFVLYWWMEEDLSNPILFWSLTVFVVCVTIYFVYAKYRLDNPKWPNIVLSLVLCAVFFFIKNEVAGASSIKDVPFYRFGMAVLDVFLVFAGTVVMDLLFEWLKRKQA